MVNIQETTYESAGRWQSRTCYVLRQRVVRIGEYARGLFLTVQVVCAMMATKCINDAFAERRDYRRKLACAQGHGYANVTNRELSSP